MQEDNTKLFVVSHTLKQTFVVNCHHSEVQQFVQNVVKVDGSYGIAYLLCKILGAFSTRPDRVGDFNLPYLKVDFVNKEVEFQRSLNEERETVRMGG